MIKKRIHQIELFLKYPGEVQEEWWRKLIQTAHNTEFGRKYGFSSIKNLEEYRQRVPLVTYEELFPYIERVMKGEQNVLWPSEIKWFAKSSGTTNARSKFIPVSPEALDECHFNGGKDMLSLHINNNPESLVFSGRGLAIGGAHQINELDPGENSYYGDVSAVLMQNLPIWAQLVRTPSLEIALIEKWEEKIERLAQITSNQNVTSITGVPTWTVLIIQRILEITGKSSLLEVWPDLEVFFHGAVAFEPYKSLFDELIPSDKMSYVETYNASEGFFGIQDERDGDLLLMLDYGIYYEFIPFDEYGRTEPQCISLHEVEVGKNYEIVISTNAGLWRYRIGDTVKFTSLSPHRIKITGRTKHFINAFGEELVIDNADQAIGRAAKVTGATINNYTAAPIYFDGLGKGGHEWVIEFVQAPDDLERFTYILDETLREVNSDYDAKRYQDMALVMPLIHVASPGIFYSWLRGNNKLGGQNKIPRLSNSRAFLNEILGIMEEQEGVPTETMDDRAPRPE